MQVPVAVANFPKELYRVPRAWAASKYNLKQWTIFNAGGVVPLVQYYSVHAHVACPSLLPVCEVLRGQTVVAYMFELLSWSLGILEQAPQLDSNCPSV